MGEKLKPCPLCGGEAKVVAYYIKGTANRLNYFVQCEENKCHRTRSRRKRANAVADWENEIFDRQHEEWMRRKRDKVKQAFIDCEKFIDEHTPEELREYEKSLNLDYESYYRTPEPTEKEKKMSEFNYLREKARMTKYLGRQSDYCDGYCNCRRCPLTTTPLSCTALETKCPEKATALVLKWAEEHPRKTRKDVLLEKFPNAKMNERGIPYVCAIPLGITARCCFCEEGEDCAACWDIEVEE